MVTGSSHASRSGQPATWASPRRPVKLAVAADAAATVMPTMTHPSRAFDVPIGVSPSQAESGDEADDGRERGGDVRADRRRGEQVAEQGAHGGLPEREPGVSAEQVHEHG